MSTESQLSENTIDSVNSTAKISLVSPASRALAAFIDYLVLMALLMFFSGFVFSFDFEFLWSFLLGSFYFGVGNSHILGGQTLGKRAFGIRVVGRNGPISFRTSLLRYCYSFGMPILLTGIPSIVLRSSEIVAHPAITELNMLVVLVYTVWNFSAILLSPTQRAKHDEFSFTAVVSTQHENDLSLETLFTEFAQSSGGTSQRKTFSAILSCVVGGFLWLFSVQHSAHIQSIYSHRYKLEQSFEIRILSLSAHSDGIVMHFAALNQNEIGVPKLAKLLATYLQDSKLLPANGRQKLIFVVLLVKDGHRKVEPIELEFTIENGVIEHTNPGSHKE